MGAWLSLCASLIRRNMLLQETIFGPSLLRDERHDRDLGEAHVLLAKRAADATISYGLSGRLYKSHSGWGLLSVPNAIVRGAFDALHEIGAELPLRNGKLNAHLSVLRPEEIEQIGGHAKISEWGHAFSWSLGPLKTVVPDGWKDVAQVWIIECSSPQIAKFRRSYGLSDSPKFPLHLTIAIRKKGTIAHNSSVSKAASAGECCPHCCANLERDPYSGNCNRCGEDWPMKKSAVDDHLRQRLLDELIKAAVEPSLPVNLPTGSTVSAGNAKPMDPLAVLLAEKARAAAQGREPRDLYSSVSDPKPSYVVGSNTHLAGESKPGPVEVETPAVGLVEPRFVPLPGVAGRLTSAPLNYTPYLLGGGLALGGIGAGFLWNRSRKKRQEAETMKKSAVDDYLQQNLTDDLTRVQRIDDLKKLAGWLSTLGQLAGGATAGAALTGAEKATGYISPEMSNEAQLGTLGANALAGMTMFNPRSRNWAFNKTTYKPTTLPGGGVTFGTPVQKARLMAYPAAAAGLATIPTAATYMDASNRFAKRVLEQTAKDDSPLVRTLVNPSKVLNEEVINPALQRGQDVVEKEVERVGVPLAKQLGLGLGTSIGGGVAGLLAARSLGQALLPDDATKSHETRLNRRRLRSLLSFGGSTAGSIGGMYLAGRYGNDVYDRMFSDKK